MAPSKFIVSIIMYSSNIRITLPVHCLYTERKFYRTRNKSLFKNTYRLNGALISFRQLYSLERRKGHVIFTNRSDFTANKVKRYFNLKSYMNKKCR